jgi:hypothetical protein
VEGVAVGAAHEAVADETDAELFLGHNDVVENAKTVSAKRPASQARSRAIP